MFCLVGGSLGGRLRGSLGGNLGGRLRDTSLDCVLAEALAEALAEGWAEASAKLLLNKKQIGWWLREVRFHMPGGTHRQSSEAMALERWPVQKKKKRQQ